MLGTARSCSFIFIILMSFSLTVPAWGQGNFKRGDSNHDKILDVSDAVYTLIYQFLKSTVPPCLDALDYDDNGSIEITDVVGLLNYLFLSGLPPADPFPVFDVDPTPDGLSCLPEVPGPVTAGGSELSGEITENVTLTNDKTYRLVSGVFIKDGAILTIEAGVTIIGDSATNAHLVIERGAKILAVGTRTHPVVFTSGKSPGERRRSDWGGILICGKGPANVSGGEWVVKGFQSLRAGGGNDPDPGDSSGRLSYVRIEYSGATVAGVPLSAISFCAVGSGTMLDHIQSKYGADDGIEWYGGTCNLMYGIAVGMGDDGFDCEYGWQGFGQFFICLQDPEAGNHGLQNSEDGGKPRAEPLTFPTLSNVVLIGAWGDGSRSGYGLRIRRFVGMNLYNTIVQGWRLGGIDFGSDLEPVTLDRCTFYDNENDCTGSTERCSALFEPPLQNTVATEAVMVKPDDLESPDLRGISSKLPPPFDPTTLDEWFYPGSYVGAVPPAGEGKNWALEPWVSWKKS